MLVGLFLIFSPILGDIYWLPTMEIEDFTFFPSSFPHTKFLMLILQYSYGFVYSISINIHNYLSFTIFLLFLKGLILLLHVMILYQA